MRGDDDAKEIIGKAEPRYRGGDQSHRKNTKQFYRRKSPGRPKRDQGRIDDGGQQKQGTQHDHRNMSDGHQRRPDGKLGHRHPDINQDGQQDADEDGAERQG